MSFGAEFKNDSGHVIIDDSRLMETFIGKASYSSTLPRSNNNIHRFVIASSVQPMVFIRSIGGYAFSIFNIIQSGGNYLIDIVSDGPKSNIHVYCFASIVQGGYNQNYGMNLYGPDGNIIFSSNWKLLNVRGVVSPPQVNQSKSHGISGLVSPAIMCPCNSGLSYARLIKTYSGYYYYEYDDRDAFVITPTTLTTKRVRVWYFQDSYTGIGSSPYEYSGFTSVSTTGASPFPIIDTTQYD